MIYEIFNNKYFVQGWNLFKMYHIEQKGPNFYYNLFLSYILISIKNKKLKFIKIFEKIIFKYITISRFHHNHP
jgi:hypothetical protein